jgi:hypothetical protein
LEKELFKIEEMYQYAVKACQQQQQKQPIVSKVQEEWGMYLVNPNL